jgi:hypothetical protein
LLGAARPDDAADELDALGATLRAQSEDFQVNWTFAGTKHFVSHEVAFAPYRSPRLEMFSALETSRRNDVLEKLQVIDTRTLRAAAQSR